MRKTAKKTVSVLLALLMLLTLFGGSLTSVAAVGNNVPTNIVAQKQEDGSIQVNWDPVDGAILYYIYIGSDGNGSYDIFTATYNNSLREAKPPAGDRYYTVMAYTNSGMGPKSAPVKAEPVPPPPPAEPAKPQYAPPAQPTGLKAEAVENSHVRLTWDADEAALAYSVRRMEKGQTEYVEQTFIMGQLYEDKNVAYGKTYLYTLVAWGHFGQSEVSAPCEITFEKPGQNSSPAPAPAPRLAAPPAFALSVEDGEWVYLEWEEVTGADSYQISRSESINGQYDVIDTVPDLYYEDFDVLEGKTYYYKVAALQGNNLGEEAGPLEAVVQKDLKLEAQAIDSESIYLTWSSVDAADVYEIHRASAEAGPYTLHDTRVTESYYDLRLEPETTYYYKIVAKANGVAIREIGPANAKTAAFAGEMLNVTATPQNSTSIKVVWNAAQDPDVDEYRVLRADSADGTYSQIQTVQGNVLEITDTGLQPNTTYYYKVVAVQTASGITKARGGPVSATTLVDKPDVFATALSSSEIKVDWSQVSGATSYRVYRATAANGPYTDLGEKTGQTFTDTGLQPNTAYYYKVAGIANGVEGEQGDPARATTLIDAPTVYATAQGLSSIYVNWTAVQGAQGYRVYRATSATGTYTDIGYFTALYMTDSGLQSNTTYWYKVAAVVNGTTGPQGGPASATTDSEKPNVYATAVDSGSIRVDWTSVNSASGYYVYRSTSANGTYTNLGYKTGTTFTDTGLNSNTTYYYKVAGYINGAIGQQGGPASATTLMDAPSVGAVALNSSQIIVTWSNVKDASGYYVYRSTSASGPYTNLGYKTGNSFTDTGLNSNTTYYYKVAGYINGAIGPEGGPASAKTTIDTPYVYAVAQSSSSILVYWDHVKDAQGYYVYRSTSANGTYTNLGYVSASSPLLSDNGLQPNTTYYYKVAGVVNGETGPQGGPAAATTHKLQLNVTVTTLSSSSLRVSWTKPAGATSYTIYRSTYNGGYVKVASVGNINSWDNTGLNAGTTYWYKVVSNNGAEGVNYGKTTSKPGNPTIRTNANTCCPYMYYVHMYAPNNDAVKWEILVSSVSHQPYGTSRTYKPGLFRLLTTVSASGNGEAHYTHRGVVPSRYYWYKIRYQNRAGVWSDYVQTYQFTTWNIAPGHVCSCM